MNRFDPYPRSVMSFVVIPLAIWKLVEINIWLFTHISFGAN